MKKIFPIIIILTIFLVGCAEETSTIDKSEPGVADYLTGAESIKTYEKAKSKIEDINKARKQQFE